MLPSQNAQARVCRLLEQYRVPLYGYILACVRNHPDAEDVFQEVAVAVTQSIGQLRTEQGFLPWAREIARRRVLVHFRCRERERPSDPEVVRRLAESADRLDPRPTPSPREEALRACLEELPASSRRLIVLRYDGRGSHELSRHFGRSVQGIYAQVKRIKQSLRAAVEQRLAEA